MAEEIILPLEHIYNMSILTGVVPSELKIARVIPIYKKGEKSDCSIYRPISMLNIFNKILEKLVFTRVISFLNKNKIIYNNQFGFRSNHSTSQALIKVLDRVYESMGKGDTAVDVYLDIEKAFDCINHNISLNKLQYYGIRGVAWNWFSSYLENRKQFVSVKYYNSSVMVINYGVPQGSVLGPLLFLLYINDIQYADSAAILNLFADDTSLFVFDKDPIELFNRCNHSLNAINDWFLANKLKLSLDKCLYTIFNMGNRRLLPADHGLSVSGIQLKRTKSVKYLGVFIDEDLTRQDHIHYLINKLMNFCSIFYKLRSILPKPI